MIDEALFCLTWFLFGMLSSIFNPMVQLYTRGQVHQNRICSVQKKALDGYLCIVYMYMYVYVHV